MKLKLADCTTALLPLTPAGTAGALRSMSALTSSASPTADSACSLAHPPVARSRS